MELDDFLARALEEDLGPGDLTTEAIVPADARGAGRIVAKEQLVVAGQEPAGRVFALLGADYHPLLADGEEARPGQEVARVEGPLRALLSGERLALNLLMHLSGIATTTREHVRAAGGAFEVVDTRKTTPLLRALEKAAVRAGGGRNHRFALYDGVLIKENHVAVAGSITEAVRRARARAHHLLRIEVEARSVEEALEATRAGADAVLLDNMDDETLARAAEALAGQVRLEASGNMDPERIRRLASLGIRLDFVSVGGLVHRARWVDLSLLLEGVEAP